MLNYRVPQKLLLPYLPPFTELDLWEGDAYISLVAFLFMDTKVLGVRWPFHTDFEEVNLRFYVKRRHNQQWFRGAAFISEIVPKQLIAWIANGYYNEHYSAMPMDHSLEVGSGAITLDYRWKSRQWNWLHVEGSASKVQMDSGSQEEFILEHYFGYNKLRANVTTQYALEHKRWELFPVTSFELSCNPVELYGEIGRYVSPSPQSIFLAEGSDVSVKMPQQIISNH